MFESIRENVKESFRSAGSAADKAGKFLAVIEPVSPYNRKGLLTALITAAGLISVTLLAGVGLAAMTLLLMSLGIILLILTRVFGVEFDFDPEQFMKY